MFRRMIKAPPHVLRGAGFHRIGLPPCGLDTQGPDPSDHVGRGLPSRKLRAS